MISMDSKSVGTQWYMWFSFTYGCW